MTKHFSLDFKSLWKVGQTRIKVFGRVSVTSSKTTLEQWLTSESDAKVLVGF